MKKFLPLLIAFLLPTNASFSIEEVKLKPDQEPLESVVLETQNNSINEEKTLKEVDYLSEKSKKPLPEVELTCVA